MNIDKVKKTKKQSSGENSSPSGHHDNQQRTAQAMNDSLNNNENGGPSTKIAMESIDNHLTPAEPSHTPTSTTVDSSTEYLSEAPSDSSKPDDTPFGNGPRDVTSLSTEDSPTEEGGLISHSLSIVESHSQQDNVLPSPPDPGSGLQSSYTSFHDSLELCDSADATEFHTVVNSTTTSLHDIDAAGIPQDAASGDKMSTLPLGLLVEDVNSTFSVQSSCPTSLTTPMQPILNQQLPPIVGLVDNEELPDDQQQPAAAVVQMIDDQCIRFQEQVDVQNGLIEEPVPPRLVLAGVNAPYHFTDYVSSDFEDLAFNDLHVGSFPYLEHQTLVYNPHLQGFMLNQNIYYIWEADDHLRELLFNLPQGYQGTTPFL